MSDIRRSSSPRPATAAWAFLLLMGLGGGGGLAAQDTGGSWERAAPATTPRPSVFSATQAVNLPTAETLAGGELLFEIAHRFQPPVSDSEDALFGLDGPVWLRLGLTWAPTDRIMVGVNRSNLLDNYDLTAKVRLVEGEGPLTWALAAAGGVGFNTDAPDAVEGSRTRQWYGQLIANAQVGERLRLGVVPWLLRNPDIEAPEAETAGGVGLYGQVDITDQVALLTEWNVTEGFSDFTHDAGSVGVVLETGGHFFTLFVTNSLRLNPTQFLAGAGDPFEADELRLGFNITRLIVF